MSPIPSFRAVKDAGRVARVPAVQLEKLVVEAIRAKAQLVPEPTEDLSDHALIDRRVTRIIVRLDSINIELREPTPATEPLPANEESVAADVPASSTCTAVISLPWSMP